MNIAWSVGFRGLIFYFAPLHTHLAWFIGAIIGAVITSFLTNKVPKKFLMISGSVLVMVGGIAAAATQYNVHAMEACLYLDGIANGLVFAPAMALAGEVTVPYLRGTITASIEQMCFAVGFFIQVTYTGSWGFGYSPYDSFTQEQLHGVLSAVFGLIGLVIAATCVVESPVIMLANGHEEQAIDTLRRLQRPAVVTTETYEQLEEHKRYLAENKELSLGSSIAQGLPALVRLIFLRTLLAMSLSTFVTSALLLSVGNSIAMHSAYWEFTVYGICRWLGTLITGFCMESLGRKKPTLVGLLVSGGLAFGIGSMLGDYPYGPIDSIFYLIFVYQIFAGIAFTATSCYLSEAYPLGVKQHYIGITFIVEMLVYIIISSSDYSVSGGSIYFYVLGTFSVCAGLLGVWFLPETRNISLREAQNKFRGFISKGF